MGTSNRQQQKEKDDIRILLVGEDGVGKTSLIMSLISEEFPDSTPARCEEVTIPADVTPERVPTRIVDFSRQEQDEEALADELHRANVICLVCAVNQSESVEKVRTFWMPAISKILGADHGKPVILVANKSDSITENSSMEQIMPLMNEYSEIETCVECSAKTMKNISELFYYAQKAVLHPTNPLYVPEDKELSHPCKKGLVRIFKICDQDNDGLLNDIELNNFQVRCFQVPLTQEAIQDVKSVVQKDITDGVLDNCLTLKGFLYLHTLFIQRGRHETTWTVLRKFGYDTTLQLTKDYLYPPIKVGRGCSTELSYDGIQFLTMLFEKYDEDKDGCLSPTELQNLFSLCPVNPWGPDVINSVATNSEGWITYEGYLSYWALTTAMDYPRILEYLAYLGFNVIYPSQLAAITITRDKRIDWEKKETAREVFQAHIIGPKDVGKTSFVQGFLGKNLKQQANVNKRHLSSYAVNKVAVKGRDKYLVLHEVDVLTPQDPLTSYELSCDVVVLIYDVSNSKSFEYCATMFKKYFQRTRVPCLIVASKADRREVLQEYDLQPLEFCQKYRLPPPLKFTAADTPPTDIYEKIANLAMCPHLKHIYYLHDSSTWWGIGAATVALIGFLIYKNAK